MTPNRNDGRPPGHGPQDPLSPIGDLEVLTHDGSGVHVIRQRYADGYIYEYMIPKGTLLDPRESSYTIPFFTARVMRAYEEGEFSYLSLWVPTQEGLVYEKHYKEAASKPDFTYQSAPEGDPEVLHQDSRVHVERVRYSAGWIYYVKLELGFPWPSSFLVPSLTPIRVAPIVSVDREGTNFTVAFWVADNAPTAPQAA